MSRSEPSNTPALKEGGGGRTSIPFDGRLDDRKNVKNNTRPFEELPPEIRELILNKKPKTKAADTMQILGEKHVLSVLLYLDKMSPVVKSDIYNDISEAGTMASKLDDQRRLGLIKFYFTVRASTNIIVITVKGRVVAALIKEMLRAFGPSLRSIYLKLKKWSLF